MSDVLQALYRTPWVDYLFWLGVIALLVLGCAALWTYWTRPAWHLISRVIYHDAPWPFRALRAMWDLLGVIATLDRAIRLLDRPHLYERVRLRIEWGLLRPNEEHAPAFLQQLLRARKRAQSEPVDLKLVGLRHMAAWHAHRIAETESRQEMYQWLHSGVPGRRRAMLDYVLARRKLRSMEAKRNAKRRLAAAEKPERDRAATEPPAALAKVSLEREAAQTQVKRKRGRVDARNMVIEVDNGFALTNATEGIKRYFDALAADPSRLNSFDGQFISSVRIKRGFFAPIHLLAGALAKFEEDWGPAISHYGNAVTSAHRTPVSQDLVRLREFQFNCWLSWGPSIPVCRCEQWTHWPRQPIYQYGYGDEANSVSVVFDDDAHAKAFENYFAAWHGSTPFALPMPVLGRVTWAPRLQAVGIDASDAQAQILQDPDRVVLHVSSPQALAAPESTGAGYYSAYVWVMFELCDANGASSPVPNEEWRCLLPFFEHANLADPHTYLETKKVLVHKTLIAIGAILARHPQVGLRYACAFDHSNCTENDEQVSGLLCRPPNAQSIRSLLLQALDQPEHWALKAEAHRLRWDWTDWHRLHYSSCHLMDRVGDYLNELERSRREPTA